MDIKLQPGQQVTVRAFGGKRPLVTVVEDRGDTVLICKPEEFEQAKREQRAPLSVGIPKMDVVEEEAVAA